jgi:hypothetical protein
MGMHHVEVGWNTSTVVLRVVGGDEKGSWCLGDINTEIWSGRLGIEQKDDELALQKLLLRNPMKWNPGSLIQDKPGRILLRKAVGEKGLFCQ